MQEVIRDLLLSEQFVSITESFQLDRIQYDHICAIVRLAHSQSSANFLTGMVLGTMVSDDEELARRIAQTIKSAVDKIGPNTVDLERMKVGRHPSRLRLIWEPEMEIDPPAGCPLNAEEIAETLLRT